MQSIYSKRLVFAASPKVQVTNTTLVTPCPGSVPVVISFRKGFHLTRLLNASLSHFSSSLFCGSWRIFRDRWLQVAPATTSRNPLSLPRQPSPSSSHPLLSPGEIQFERARTSLKEGRKGAGFRGARRKRGGVPKQRREKKMVRFLVIIFDGASEDVSNEDLTLIKDGLSLSSSLSFSFARPLSYQR